MEDSIEKLKEDFEAWSGFKLEATEPEDMQNEIDQRAYDLECEIFQKSKAFRSRVKYLFPDSDLTH